jgi:GT2 family glycosyltransferase
MRCRDAAPPVLSVIIACYRAAGTVARCLDSLQRQETRHPFEVVVVNSSPDATPQIIKRDFPWVRCVEFASRKYAGDARNEGIAVARGRVIALTDADCVVAPNWVDAILAAHRAPHPAIGGAVANANPGSLAGWAGYLLEFHQWLPSKPAGWMDDVCGANLSYKRELFDRLGWFISGTYGSDTEFHWRLARAGHRVWFDPSIRVQHRNIEDLGRLLTHEFEHGRCFARVRAGAQGFSVARRAVFAGLFPLIGVKLFLRAVRSAMGADEARQVVPRVVPMLLAGHAAWSLGEAAGYVAGQYHAGLRRSGAAGPGPQDGRDVAS